MSRLPVEVFLWSRPATWALAVAAVVAFVPDAGSGPLHPGVMAVLGRGLPSLPCPRFVVVVFPILQVGLLARWRWVA